jgi:ribosomal RNA-processing protein 36
MSGKINIDKVQEFDEASSSSESDGDDDSSGSSSSEDGDREDNQHKHSKTKQLSVDASSDNGQGSDDDDDDDDKSTSSFQNHVQNEQVGESDDDDDDYGSSDNNQSEGDSDEDLPLHERIRRKEERGLSLQQSRERKSRALKVASERLSTLKGESTFTKKRRKSSHDDNAKPIKKKNKHRPAEVSSKRSEFFRRGAPKLNESGIGVEIGAHRYKPLDPRVSNLTGHYNEDQFQKNYAFLEEMRNQEIGQVRKRIAALKATGNPGKRMRRKLEINGSDPQTLEEYENRLKSLTQQRSDLERQKVERAAKQSVKRKIREDVESGKNGGYFLKRREKKQLEAEAKLEEIRKRKGSKAVEKILAKKRQKNKSRDAGIFAK